MATDGGWGWVVVLGSFICHFFLVGVSRSIGIVYVLLEERFQASATDTALTASIFISVVTFGGILPKLLGLYLLAVVSIDVTRRFTTIANRSCVSGKCCTTVR